IRKHVDGKAREGQQAIGRDGYRGDKHHQPIGEARANNCIEHGRPSYRTWLISSAPWTTTRSPASMPETINTRSPSSGRVRTGWGLKRSGAVLIQTWDSPLAARTTAA